MADYYINHANGPSGSGDVLQMKYDSTAGKLVLTITPNDGTAATVVNFSKDA